MQAEFLLNIDESFPAAEEEPNFSYPDAPKNLFPVSTDRPQPRRQEKTKMTKADATRRAQRIVDARQSYLIHGEGVTTHLKPLASGYEVSVRRGDLAPVDVREFGDDFAVKMIAAAIRRQGGM